MSYSLGVYSEETVAFIYDFKQCGESAIPDWKKCKKKVIEHTATHLGKSAAAWKTGKILGQAIAAGIESHFGVPREVGQKISETVVQGVAATVLDAKHLANPEEFIKKLVVETSAAFVGKTAHMETENFLSSEQAKETVKQVLPILAGKFAGIGTAFAGGRTPSPAQLGKMILERSQRDSQELLRMVRPASLSYAEMGPSEEFLADVSMLLFLYAFSKNKGITNS